MYGLEFASERLRCHDCGKLRTLERCNCTGAAKTEVVSVNLRFSERQRRDFDIEG